MFGLCPAVGFGFATTVFVFFFFLLSYVLLTGSKL
jgi:hypothetical protein